LSWSYSKTSHLVCRIGQAVGLNAAQRGERVRKMEDAGVITGVRARLIPQKIGLPIAALIRIKRRGRCCWRH